MNVYNGIILSLACLLMIGCGDQKFSNADEVSLAAAFAKQEAESTVMQTEEEEKEEEEEDLRCYISHGGGHGIELCMVGDKGAIKNFAPIEIKGNQICVPESTVLANEALFESALLGRCPKELKK